MHRPSRYAGGLLALLVVIAQTASALTLTQWGSRELGPALGAEIFQTLTYELGPPSGPDTATTPDTATGFGRDLHYFVVERDGVNSVFAPGSWPPGAVVYNHGDHAYDQTGWTNWGGTCFVGLDSAVVASGFPVPVCVGSDGNVWGFWGANGQFLITINDPQVKVRPAIASRGDWTFDSFYVHSGTWELWHTGWSPAGGWIDEPLVVAGTPIYANPTVGGVDAVWASYGAQQPWTHRILVSYLTPDGRPAVLTGSSASSGFAASNNINWTSNVIVSSNHPTRFPSIALVGTPGGTQPVVFYDDGPGTCLRQQADTFTFFTGTWTIWSAPEAIDVGSTYYCGDVAARAARNGSFGAKVNLWQPQNFQIWSYSR